MITNIFKILFIVIFINSPLAAQSYEIKFDSLNASGWFGGDSRPGQQRNVAVAQSVTIEQPFTLEYFAFYFTSPFDSTSSASGIGYEVTLRLHIRDSSGVILQTNDVVVADTFTQGWVAWTNINLDITDPGKYIFSTYLLGGYDSLPVNSGQGCDANANYPGGERYSKYVTNDTEAELWEDWSNHSWDSNFWLTGSLLPTSVTEENSVAQFILMQNYPNPFNPSTTIKYTLQNESNIRITVLNILGEKVEELLNELKPAGTYTIDFNSGDLPSGVYFYHIEARTISGTRNFTAVKKMVLLK